MKNAIAYTMNLGATAEQLAEQHLAIKRFAAENNLRIVATFDDADPEESDAFTRFAEQHCHATAVVAFDTTSGRPTPELWNFTPCHCCGGEQLVAAVDGELIAGCEAEPV